MPIDAQSPEFARLATRWLEGSATLVDAAKLWDAIKTDPACAREFASQARFELLLQDTLRERQREIKIVNGARQQATRHYRRVATRRVLAAAAIVLAVGLVVRWVMPTSSREPVTTLVAETQPKPVPKPSGPILTQPHTGLTTLLVQGSKEHGDEVAKEPLKKRLDDFFLIGVHFDKVPLREALKQLEDQLRELNYANSAELAALRVKLMPGAGDQLVTFHSGSISFLKAARALASLAGFDMDVSDTGVSLIAKADGLPEVEKSHNLGQLAQSMGTTTDSSRSRLAELINDARGLGLRFDISKEGNITNLYATPGELIALALLAQSRDQIRALPPLQFYVHATRGGPPDRVVTGAEADRIRADYLSSAGPNPQVITVPMMETNPPMSSTVPGEFVVGATPVGENYRQITFTPQTDSLIPLANNPTSLIPPNVAWGATSPSPVADGHDNIPELTPPDPANTASSPSPGLPQITPVSNLQQAPTIAVIKPADIIQFSAAATPIVTLTTGGLAFNGNLGAANNIGSLANVPSAITGGATQTLTSFVRSSDDLLNILSVTKNGSGNLLFSGNNAYAGATSVNAGNVAATFAPTAEINYSTIDWTRWSAVSYNFTVNESNASQMAFASAAQAQLGDKVHITIIPKTP